MKKINLKNLILDVDEAREETPKINTIRRALIFQMIIIIIMFFPIISFSLNPEFKEFWLKYSKVQIDPLIYYGIGALILIPTIIYATYESYKITKLFERWEKDYDKYRKLLD